MITIILGAAVGCSFIALLRLARTAGVRHAPRPAARPDAFRPAPDGVRWLPCHDAACDHMTTRWIPSPDGKPRCEQAAQHRGDVHLTDTTQGD